jgi:hypothetical protein
VKTFGVRRKSETSCCKAIPLNINSIVYFICFQENVVVIDCTNVNYNGQPHMEGDLDSLDRMVQLL